MTGPDTDGAVVARRAHEIFAGRFDANVKRVDRMFIYLMAAQWLCAIALALWFSPYAWEGRIKTTHVHVLAAVVLGGLLSGMPIFLALVRPGAIGTRFVIAAAQMLWSGLLIHLMGGRIETHFHVFGSLAFLAFYRDWRVLVPATVVVAADHVVRQVFWPESVFGVLTPEAWRFLEHAFWVVFEDVFLVLSCLAGVKEMRGAAEQQARIEVSERREKELASTIQTSILPRTLAVEGLDVAAVMATATEVGGDYYEVLPVADGCWIGIGDVAGHGLPAGLVMLQTQSAVGALVGQDPTASPDHVLCGVNRVLYENIRKRLHHDEHVTMSLMRYHRDGRVVFAGAHEDIVVWRAATGTCETIATPGTWLGMTSDIRRATVNTACQLHPDDVMLLYTDGVTEAMDGKREQFGLARLCASLEEVARGTVEQIRDHLLARVRAWSPEQVDDITILVARYRDVDAVRVTTPRRSVPRFTAQSALDAI